MSLFVAECPFLLCFQHLFKPQPIPKRNVSIFVDVLKAWFSLFCEAALLFWDLGIPLPPLFLPPSPNGSIFRVEFSNWKCSPDVLEVVDTIYPLQANSLKLLCKIWLLGDPGI